MASRFRMVRAILALLLVGIFLAIALWPDAPASDVKLVIVLTRHGVRTPLSSFGVLGNYSTQAWPQWDVPSDYLTGPGRRMMIQMGDYYRERYLRAGLLTGNADRDRGRIFFRADSDERTAATARALSEALLPGRVPEVHARPLKQVDPLFEPGKVLAGRVDEARAYRLVKERMGGDPAVIPEDERPLYAKLQQVLFGGDGRVPPGKISVLDVPVTLAPGAHGEVVDLTGPLHRAESLIDSLQLEYLDGMPASDVGWGRLDRAGLTELLALHARYFDVTQRTFYMAQVQSSDLASHLLDTMVQAIRGQPQAGAFGTPADRMVFIVGHDTNIANLGGLLGMSWWLPDLPVNPMLPGGALVFELRQPRDGGEPFVRAYYVSQSLDQMRTDAPLTLRHPPWTSDIYIPGCSEPVAGFDAPYGRFAAQVRREIDPRFVIPGTP
jgi:4-phytase/acid phosphatase